MQLFAPPERLAAAVFARLPERFRIRGRSNHWIDVQRGGAPTDSFLEAPTFDRDGNLYVTDVAWGRVFRVSPDGRDWTLVAEWDGEPNGLAIHADGRLFVTDFKNGLVTVDPASGAVTPFLTRIGLDRFKGLNDLFFAGNGDLFFTDQGGTGLHDPTGRLWKLHAATGRLESLVDTLPSPNSLAANPEGTLIYVNITRANAVWRVPLLPCGGTFKVGNFIQLSGGLGGPDGIAVDEKGGLCITHIGLGVVWVFDRLGQPVYRIDIEEGLGVTNCAYGGPDNRTLYITEAESGTILTCRLPVPGLRPFSHR